MEAALREKLERLPRAPGVYVMRDREGRVLYVGKATDLRSRVRSYFAPGTGDPRFFLPLLEEQLGDLETVVTADAREALLLENSLIKSLKPRYNVRLRDDKDYLSVRLDARADWPRLELVRRPRPDGARYFGPFAAAREAREAVRTLSRMFQLRICTDPYLRRRTRPCLQYDIGRCPAPCVRPVDREAYHRAADRAAALLEGRRDAVLEELRAEMAAAADRLQYERAADLRDQLVALERSAFGAPQRVVEVSRIDRDVLGLHRDGPAVQLAVLEIRRGRLVACRSFAFGGVEVPDTELLAAFLSHRYAEQAAPPDEILLPADVPERALFAAAFSAARGRRVTLSVPRRGRLRALVDMARANAEQRYREENRERQNARDQAEALARALRLPRPPHLLECVDISHFGAHAGGEETVAAVVALRDGRPAKDRYRRFRLHEAHGADDYAAIRETVRRRFERAREADPKWAAPDLFLVDGGRGQLAVAAAVLDDLGFHDLMLAALAKGRPPAEGGPAAPDQVYVRGRANPVRLRPGSAPLHFLARARDEAHRFAGEYQAHLRARRTLDDRLAAAPGVGPVTRRRLLQAFGSVARVAAASPDELAAVPGVTRARAEALLTHLRPDAEPGDPAADDADLETGETT